MDSLVHCNAAVLADMPVSGAVHVPGRADVQVSAVRVVVAEFETLVVFIAPMLGKLIALYTEVVVAASIHGVVVAAILAESTVVALIAFIAVAALFADEVVAFIVVQRADVVFAMLVAALAQTAVFAKFIKFEALAAVLTQTAVLALFVLRTLSAFGAKVVFIIS